MGEKSKHVMVVCSSSLSLSIMSDTDINVETADTIMKAFGKLKGSQFDAIIINLDTDIKCLWDYSQIVKKFCERVRELEPLPILMAVTKDEGDFNQAYMSECGFKSYFLKPIQRDFIISVLKSDEAMMLFQVKKTLSMVHPDRRVNGDMINVD